MARVFALAGFGAPIPGSAPPGAGEFVDAVTNEFRANFWYVARSSRNPHDSSWCFL